MSRHPEQAPLGATPVLPPPEGASAKAAAELFARALEREKQHTAALHREAQSSSGGAAGIEATQPSVSPPPRTGGGRRYDLALAAAGLASEVAPGGSAPLTGAAVDVSPPAEREGAAEAGIVAGGSVGHSDPEATGIEQLPRRPPPGVPVVRASAKRARSAEAAPDWRSTLEATTQDLQMVAEPDGSTAFEITLRDDVLEDVTCRVAIRDKRLVAVFRVADASIRRLLEAESGRLRVRLEERGLYVQEIRVVEA